jgi:hypothetical protein
LIDLVKEGGEAGNRGMVGDPTPRALRAGPPKVGLWQNPCQYQKNGKTHVNVNIKGENQYQTHRIE